MNRCALLLLVAIGSAKAAGSVFVFPHLDADQPWQPIRATSFGTLTDIDSAPPLDRSAAVIEPGSLLAAGPRADDGLTEGVAWIEAERPERALQPLRRAVSGARQQDGPMSPSLVAPWTALGLAHLKLGQFDKADHALAQAQGIIQRHQGAASQPLMPLLLARAETWRAREEAFETEQLLRTWLKLARRHYPPDSPERVAATIRVGRALTEMAQYRDALTLYRSELLRLRDAGGNDPPLAAEVMAAMAQTFLLQGGHEVDRGRTLSRKVADLTERYPAEFSLDQRIRAQLAAGDWLTLFDQPRTAARYYARAWRLAREGRDDHYWLARMTRPTLIFAGPDVTLDQMGYHWADRMAYTEFRLDVRASGKPDGARVTGGNLHGSQVRMALEMIRLARFRPAIIDGVPVATPKLRFTRVYDTRPPEDFGAVRLGLD